MHTYTCTYVGGLRGHVPRENFNISSRPFAFMRPLLINGSGYHGYWYGADEAFFGVIRPKHMYTQLQLLVLITFGGVC